jgi:hypothetical protein
MLAALLSVAPATPRESPLDALVEMVGAVNVGAADRYARVYAEDAVITIHGTTRLEGRPAIEAYEVALLKEFPGTRLAFDTVWQKGTQAVVHYAVRSPARPHRETGHEGLLFYRFGPTGLVEEEHRYLDSLTPMAQLGRLGSRVGRPRPTPPDEMTTYVSDDSARERENLDRVKRSVAALDAGSTEASPADLTDDVVVDELVDPEPHTGAASVGAWIETWRRAIPDARYEITNAIAIGDDVLLEIVVRGTCEGPLAGFAPSHAAVTLHRAAIVEIKDSKIARIRAFMNGRELAQEVGQWPPRPTP